MANGPQFDPGQMEPERVLIRQRTQQPDGAGGWTEDWSTYAERYAVYRSMSGDRRFAAAQTDYPRDVEFPFRTVDVSPEDLSEDMAIVRRGKAYGVQYIEDFGRRAAWVKVEAKSGDKQDALP